MLSTIDTLEESLRTNAVNAKKLIQNCRQSGLVFRAHPLGFIVCNLLEEGDRKARLHIWPLNPKNSQGDECQIHDHIFSFSSWVIFGVVENIEYLKSVDGDYYALYETEYSGETSILKKSNLTIQLKPESRIQHVAGSSYGVCAGKLHQTRRIGITPAVTVLITENSAKKTPIVAGNIEGPTRYDYVRSALTTIDLDAVILEICLESPPS